MHLVRTMEDPSVLYNVYDGSSIRLLQEDTNGTTGAATGIDFNSTAGLSDTDVLRTTCKLYGSIFLVLFVVFLIFRIAFPGVYNLKKSYEHMHIPLSSQPYGFLSWIWSVFVVQYDDIAEQCGMDAVTTIRLFEFGVKISLISCLNSFYLFPVYKYLGDVVVGDPVKELSLSNLSPGHPGTIATAIAAYVFFCATMHFIDKDFEWLTEHRHNFLSKKRVQNYSIFLSNLPKHMQSDTAIQNYFRDCFSHNAVVDGDVALNIPKLEALTSRRDALISKFEHAINVRFVKGEEPMHSTKLCGGEKVESIPTYKEELANLNKEISETIDKIVAEKESRRAKESGDAEVGVVETSSTGFGDGESMAKAIEALDDQPPKESNETGEVSAPDNEETPAVPRQASIVSASSSGDLSATFSAIKSIVVTEEGSPRSAAFVTFADLVSANMALQTVHQAEPWDMVANEAPSPRLVNWPNIGVSNHAKKIGELISLAATCALCLLWTIPVSFVASLSNVEGLQKIFPFLSEPIQKYPWFSNLMAQLAPLILTVFISILPYILLFFVVFEKPIEVTSMQHPSLLSKLSAFTIIQTFFISTLSGSLFQSIQDIIDDPVSAVPLVASALVGQSAFFIQLILVQNLLALAIELLRISPVAQEWLGTLVKKLFGYNLTEKERNTSFLGIRDIADPLEYYFGRELGSKTILLMMVLYVYGCIAPITSYFTLGIFLLIASGFRNQFIYVYPIANDSGGRLWLNFTSISVVCMIVAEIILCAILFLQQGFIAGVLMIPLIVLTILFHLYFHKRHYMVTNFLPLGDAAVVDKKNKEEGMTYEWLEDAFLQPAMKDRLKFPCNYGKVDEEYAAAQKAAKELAEKIQMGEVPEEASGADATVEGADAVSPPKEKGGCVIS